MTIETEQDCDDKAREMRLKRAAEGFFEYMTAMTTEWFQQHHNRKPTVEEFLLITYGAAIMDAWEQHAKEKWSKGWRP